MTCEENLIRYHKTENVRQGLNRWSGNAACNAKGKARSRRNHNFAMFVCTSSTIMPDLRRWAQRKTTPPRPLGTNNPRLSLYDTQGKEFLHRVAISDSTLKGSLPPLESGEMIALSRMNPESGHPVIIPPPA